MRGGMPGGMVVVLGGLALLMGATVTVAHEPHELNDGELRYEMMMNRSLGRFIDRYGWPDIAESRFLFDTPPWDDHEVNLYYLEEHKELGFARAYILGRPSVSKMRFQRALSDDEVSALAPRARQYGTRSDRGRSPAPLVDHARRPNGPAERAEAAAERAEAAAARVATAAEVAERAAVRTETIVAKMEARAPRRAKPASPPPAAASN